jgi:hypothetical protein
LSQGFSVRPFDASYGGSCPIVHWVRTALRPMIGMGNRTKRRPPASRRVRLSVGDSPVARPLVRPPGWPTSPLLPRGHPRAAGASQPFMSNSSLWCDPRAADDLSGQTDCALVHPLTGRRLSVGHSLVACPDARLPCWLAGPPSSLATNSDQSREDMRSHAVPLHAWPAVSCRGRTGGLRRVQRVRCATPASLVHWLCIA